MILVAIDTHIVDSSKSSAPKKRAFAAKKRKKLLETFRIYVRESRISCFNIWTSREQTYTLTAATNKCKYPTH